MGSPWFPGWGQGPLQPWILSCRGLRRSSAPALWFTSLFCKKIFELNKVTSSLVGRVRERRGRAPWQQAAQPVLESSSRLGPGLLSPASGCRRGRSTGEYTCAQGDVESCLLQVLLKISTSEEKSVVNSLSIFNFTQWKTMLPS